MSDAPSSELRLRFAMAVAAPDAVAWEIDKENQRVGPRRAVREAVELDLAFYVRSVSPDILAVDFDKNEPATGAARLYLALRERGYLPVLLASGGDGGRRHVFCRVPEAEQGPMIALAQELRGNHRTEMRPPLARHKLGGRGNLLLPEDPEESLRRLHSSPGSPLGGKTSELLHTAYAARMDRSELLQSLAVGVINRDWTWEEFVLLIGTPGTLAHELFVSRSQSRGPEQTWQWARQYTWDSAVAYVEANPPVAGHTHAPLLPSLLAYDAATAWPGRSGPARRAVFLALARCYATYGTQPFHASRRKLLELSGLGSTNTVSAALHALEEAKVIVRRSRVANAATDEHGATDAWSFDGTVIRRAEGEPALDILSRRLVGHDLFNYRQLGKTAELVYHRIVQGVVDEGELRCRTEMSARTLHQHLQRLMAVGLVQQDRGGTWVSTEATLDDVAQQLEIPSYAAVLQQRHRKQRLAYREWQSKQENAF